MQATQTKQVFSPPVEKPTAPNSQNWLLYISALVAAFTAIAYELLLASYATFLLGASIFQYSFVLSLMMASMGVGALITKKWKASAHLQFLAVELILAWVAAIAIPTLYFTFSSSIPPHSILILFVVIIGGCIGMEIPLLNAIQSSKRGLSTILFYDYFGGFVGGILFPIWLLPSLGFFRLGALLSTMNAALAIVVVIVFRQQLPKPKLWLGFSLVTFVLAAVSLAFAERLRRVMEFGLYKIYEVL